MSAALLVEYSPTRIVPELSPLYCRDLLKKPLVSYGALHRNPRMVRTQSQTDHVFRSTASSADQFSKAAPYPEYGCCTQTPASRKLVTAGDRNLHQPATQTTYKKRNRSTKHARLNLPPSETTRTPEQCLARVVNKTELHSCLQYGWLSK